MNNKPTTFSELLARWEKTTDLSVDLNIPRVTAHQMKKRGSVSVRHWPFLIQAAARKGIKITAADLMEMTARKGEYA